MLKLTTRFCRDESGATAIEYTMLVVFIALAIAVGAQTLGQDLSEMFAKIGTTLAGVTIPTPPAT